MEDGALTAVGSEEKVVPESQVKELEAMIRRLEQILTYGYRRVTQLLNLELKRRGNPL